MLADPAPRVAPPATAPCAVAATGDRHALRCRAVSPADVDGNAAGRRFAWRRGAGRVADRHRAVAVAIPHERPRPLVLIASVPGAAAVIAFSLRQGGGTFSTGDLLLFAAVAVSAIGYAFSGRLTSQMPGWEVISWILVIALPLSIPAAALAMPADVTHIALKPWLGLLYVALFSQWIGFFAWNAGLAIGGIARVSQVQLLQPFVTFALAAAFAGETITLQILLFAAAVVLTVAISTRTRARPAPTPAKQNQQPPQLAA